LLAALFMHEPATALTDLLLAIEGATLAIMASRTKTNNHPLRGTTVLLFWALAVAALLGFITHGFVPAHTTLLFKALWRLLLLGIAVAGAATWAAAGMLWPSVRVQRLALQFAGVLLIVLAAAILLNVRHWAEEYDIAIASYAPAMVFLLISFVAAFVRTHATLALFGAIGVLLSFLAAGVQQSTAALGPVDHNALYHIIPAVGLVLLFVALRDEMQWGDSRRLPSGQKPVIRNSAAR
jgi:hypothetical protein